MSISIDANFHQHRGFFRLSYFAGASGFLRGWWGRIRTTLCKLVLCIYTVWFAVVGSHRESYCIRCMGIYSICTFAVGSQSDCKCREVHGTNDVCRKRATIYRGLGTFSYWLRGECVYFVQCILLVVIGFLRGWWGRIRTFMQIGIV